MNLEWASTALFTLEKLVVIKVKLDFISTKCALKNSFQKNVRIVKLNHAYYTGSASQIFLYSELLLTVLKVAPNYVVELPFNNLLYPPCSAEGNKI